MATTLPSLMADNTLNISTLRAPLASSHAPSMADTLPTLNFGFDSLRATMMQFTARFDTFIELGRRRVLEERNAYRMSIAEMSEQHASTSRTLTSLQQKTSTHNTALSAQTAETAEMHTAISSLTQTRDAHAANVAALRQRLASCRGQLAHRKGSQKERQTFLEQQSGRDGAEVSVWEERLGLRIESTGAEDRVRFVFTLDKTGRGRQDASFDLDMRSGSYEVVATKPNLEGRRDRVETLVRGMCEEEDLGTFLKGMRELFADALS